MVKIKQLDASQANNGDALIFDNGLTWSSSSTQKMVLPGTSVSSGSASSPAYTFRDGNSGMYLISGGKMGFSTSGTLRAFINTVSFTSYLPIRLPGGSGPVYTFDQDSDTGMGTITGNDLALWSGGELKMRYTTTATISYGGMVLPTGTTQERHEAVGSIRHNTDIDAFEGKTAGGWVSLSGNTQPFNRVVVNTATYAVTGDEDYLGIKYDGPVTITLPVVMANTRIIVKDERGTSATKPIILSCDGTTIDGQTTFIIQSNYAAISLLYGDQWYVF